MGFEPRYLKGYNPEEDSYQLNFPNQEVEQAFLNSLLEKFAEIEPLTVRRAAKEIKQKLELFNLGAFVTKINAHFVKVAYHLFYFPRNLWH